MNQVSSVKKNYLFNSLYQIVSVVCSFVVIPYVSRILGPEGVGIQSYTESVSYYFMYAAPLGVVWYGQREISRVRNDKKKYTTLFWEIQSVVFLSSVICSFAWMFVVTRSSGYRLYYIILSLNILSAMLDVSWLYSGLERFRTISVRYIACRLTQTILTFTLVRSVNDLWIYVLLGPGALTVLNITYWISLPQVLSGDIKIKELNPVRHIKALIIYFIPTITAAIFPIMDKSLIGLITRNQSESGYYAQASKMISVAQKITMTSMYSAVGVRMSYLMAEDDKNEEIKRRFEVAIEYVFFVGIFCNAFICGIAKEFVPVFLGNKYEAVVSLLWIYSPIILIAGVSGGIMQCLFVPKGKIVSFTVFSVISLIVNIAVDFLLIPSMGAAGAIVGELSAQIVLLVLSIIGAEKISRIKLIKKDIWKKLMAGVMMWISMFAVGIMVKSTIMIIILKTVIGLIVFVGILLLFRDRFFLGQINNLKNRIRKKD